MRIACDLGFGYLKAVNEHGRTVIFASLVAQKMTGGLSDVLNFGSKEDYTVIIWPDGKPNEAHTYYVGDAAMTAGGAVRTWEDNAAQNANMEVLIATAIALLGDNQPVDLVVGLPISFYAAQKEQIKDALKNFDYAVTIKGSHTKKAKINSVFVFPQCVGAYYAACMDINGTIKDESLVNSPVGMIEIGYRTTDYLVMVKGRKGLVPRDDLTGSLDLGMNIAIQGVQRKAEEMVKKPVEYNKVEQALMWDDGVLSIAGKEYNLRDAEGQAYKALADQISSKIKAIWGTEIDYLAAVFVAGGGGNSLYPYLKNVSERIRLMDNASFANALGYLAVQALRAKRN